MSKTSNSVLIPKYIKFGTYKVYANKVEFDEEVIKFLQISEHKNQKKTDSEIVVPLTEIQHLLYSSHSKTQFIRFKPTKESNDKIHQSLRYRARNCFNVNSHDQKKCFIKIAIKYNVENKVFTDLIELIRKKSIKFRGQRFRGQAIAFVTPYKPSNDLQ